MKRCCSSLLCGCLLLVGCGEDPAKSVKVVSRPTAVIAEPQPATEPALPAVAANKETKKAEPLPEQVEFCPPEAETAAGSGTFTVNGPCRYQIHAPVSCEGSADDFYAASTRAAKLNATLVTYLNVENYKGPGTYDSVQMFVTVQSGSKILRWSNDHVHATVAPDGSWLDVAPAQLISEPTLLDCTLQLGKETNYQYQCGRRGTEQVAVASNPLTVSGRLECAGNPQK